MTKIRVLVVDDTVVIRKLVRDVLSQEPDIEVVGVAANGKIALEKVRQVCPDVVTLDIEMPVMDGLEMLSKLRVDHPKLPVIMFSTLTERGAAMTLEALARGASDYVTKPTQTGSLKVSLDRVREELLPKVRALCLRSAVSADRMAQRVGSAVAEAASSSAVRSPQRALRAAGPVEAVLIGVSTGGPNALSEVIPALGDLPVPLLIVQHMPPMFTRMLAQRLDALSPVRIEEGEDGAPVEPGRAYVAPGGRHMELRRRPSGVAVALTDGPEENSCRPAVDVLFRSAVEVYGGRVLALVLTGMGYDGLRGCERIVEAGGLVLAQDEPSSVVWGMPGAVATAGLAESILPLSEIGGAAALKLRARACATSR